MAGGGGLDLIAAFEEEQKTVVFSGKHVASSRTVVTYSRAP